ncbi:MAG: ADP-glyceromanno-heptose 6-epimerase [Desulfomonile sp.]|nr:ADP-glyceromanno-heptose 6-epimerase [Desulfomonile sp.]
MIIVTGGAGFIGSNIVRALNDAGEDRVLIVDHLGTSEKWKNLADLRFLDYEHKDEFLAKVERGAFDHDVRAVFHMGACSSTTELNADYLMANNYAYSRRLAQRFGQKDGLRFIYASSAATYGDGSEGYSDSHDAVPKLRPLNMYGYSKQLFDLWALRTGFIDHAVGIKYFNVFGPNEYHKADMRSVAIRAYFQVKKTGGVRLFKSYRPEFAHGEQKRDFIYVKDAVRITLHFLEHPECNGLFNAGTGAPRTFRDLVAAVFTALGKEPSIEFIDMPEGLEKRYQYYTCAETAKLRAAGFVDGCSPLEDAVRDYVQNYLEKDPRGEAALETN